MKIGAFVWAQDRIDHIARHGVLPHEVEEVCFSDALIQRTRREGPSPVYYVLGRTRRGRYLFCVVIAFADGKGYPVTARPMIDKEKKRYRRWKTK